MRRPAPLLALLLLCGPAIAHQPVVRHEATVRLDPAVRTLSVEDAIQVTGVGTVRFRLAPFLRITAASVDGRPQTPTGGRGDWRINLGAAGLHQVRLAYRGTLAALPEGGGAAGPGRAVAGPAGAYLPPSAAWLPVFEDPFAYRVAVDTPAPHRAVLPGRLVEESAADGRRHAVFESETPSDGAVLLAGPYVVDERRHGDILVRTWFHPEIAALAPGYLDSTAGYLDLYETWIGDYPFSAFHVVSGPLPVGLGFPGLTYVGARVLRLPFIRGSSLGHEVLHSWWGNGVLVDYRRGNWAEGLTTYMADYTYALQRSPDEAREMRLGWLRDYAALPADRDAPAVSFVSKRHDAAQVIGYHKVAFLFHMLRRDLGEAAFDRAVRLLWQRHKFRVAAWPDLLAVFEEASGRALGQIFDQWLTRTGAPSLRLGAVTVEADGNDYRVAFALGQEEPAYALTVPVAVATDDGEQRFDVRLDGRETRAALTVGARPRAVAVDPDYDVFRRLAPDEAPPILRDVTLTADAAVVLAADGPARDVARRLAGRMMDTAPRFTDAPARNETLLILGTADRVGPALAAAGLPPMPGSLAGRGTARVWAGRADGRAFVVVDANDAAALTALLRPLPHYGRQGYLVFEGAKAVERGTWPAGPGPLRVTLE